MAPQLAPIADVTLNVTESDGYDKFMEVLRTALAGDNPDMVVGPKSKVKRTVLSRQTLPDQQPPRWICVMLKGYKGAEPKVAIRSDDAYIVGFSNSKGHWFQLSKTGTEVIVDYKKPVKMLGFDGNYNTLVKDGGINGLPKLNLSGVSMAAAAGKLWNHNSDDDDDETTMLGNPNDYLKKEIAILCVALCEAARFTCVSEVINKDWSNPQVSIKPNEVNYIRNWGDLSKKLLEWKNAGYKGDKELFKQFKCIQIDDGEKALAMVQLVKQNSRSKSLLAWLKYFLGLLVKKFQQDTTVYEKPKGSAVINPL